jgi:hypothetical protein
MKRKDVVNIIENTKGRTMIENLIFLFYGLKE